MSHFRNFRECFTDVHGNFLLKAMFFKDAKKKNFFSLIFARAR